MTSNIILFYVSHLASLQCGPTIQRAWDSAPIGSPMFQLTQRLKTCKRGLQLWSTQEFGNGKTQLATLRQQLSLVQGQPPTAENMAKQSQLKVEIDCVLLREEMFLHQRSRIRWLNFGDKNSAFFHSTVTQRRQQNQLVKLQTEEGRWLTTDEEIDEHLLHYFSEFYTAGPRGDMEAALQVLDPVISPEANEALTRVVSDSEIKAAAFQLGSLKALGPDGFPGFFY
ncbi:unnamed protein product [Camellia sinensis]